MKSLFDLSSHHIRKHWNVYKDTIEMKDSPIFRILWKSFCVEIDIDENHPRVEVMYKLLTNQPTQYDYKEIDGKRKMVIPQEDIYDYENSREYSLLSQHMKFMTNIIYVYSNVQEKEILEIYTTVYVPPYWSWEFIKETPK